MSIMRNKNRNNLRGNNRNNRLRGTLKRDSILGLGGNDTLLGFAGNDILNGGTGNDSLDGGIGADRLIGAQGNDTYIVDNTGDYTIELTNQGIDTVFASINWTLADNLENLTLQGSAINGTGNSLNNTITGNAANNILDGGVGADVLIGGAGDDIYIFDNLDDRALEKPGEGIDTFILSFNGGLADNWENLTLIGNATDGFGNALSNVIIGNNAENVLDGEGGDDVLDGGVGIDRLSGGLGNDTYLVDDYRDNVVENGGQGIDLVRSPADFYFLKDNVENLKLLGTANINGYGNELNNVLIGNSGDNSFKGYAGDDIITGGSGSDGFFFADSVFNSSKTFINTDFGVDKITDFSVQDRDTIFISKRLFGLASEESKTGFTVASEFSSVLNDAVAATSSATIVYSEATRTLFYNANGRAAGFGAAGASGAFAMINIIDAPRLIAADFFISSF